MLFVLCIFHVLVVDEGTTFNDGLQQFGDWRKRKFHQKIPITFQHLGVEHCEEQHEGTQKWEDDVHQSYNSCRIIFIIAVAVVGRYCVVVAWTKTCV
mgnify:CR=1 FL=1